MNDSAGGPGQSGARPDAQPTDLPDADVVAAVTGGDIDLFGVLIRRHQDAMHRLAFSMVQDLDTAADLVQDAFVRGFVNLSSCRAPDRVRVWLMTLLRNRCLDHLKERRRADVPLDALPEIGAASEDALAAISARTELQRALDSLPVSLREAFLLRHVEDMDYDEIADVLGTSMAGVKMRVSRARDALREHLNTSRAADDGAPMLPDAPLPRLQSSNTPTGSTKRQET